MEKCGIVVIGRNEGKHLTDCFKSIAESDCVKVYADSASSDNSVEIANQFNIEIVQLDTLIPLTAARGRNAGAKRLLELDPHTSYIQFIDGDTILEKGWLLEAQRILQEKPEVAIVAGKLIEKNETLSIYKQLSALEWERNPGETKFCGGNCMIRAHVFLQIGGFNQDFAGGEEPELCYRVREKGWKIFQSDALMGIHDSRVFSFKQFCKRCVRTGYAYQQISTVYADTPEKLFLRENISNWIYGGIIPIVTIALIPFTSGWSLILLIIYPLLFVRIYLRMKRWKSSLAFAYALTCVITKFPGFYGACKCLIYKGLR